MRGLSLKLFAGLVGSITAALLCFAPARAETPMKKVSVVAVAPTSLFWPLYIADGNGLYKAKGLDVSLAFSGSATGPMQLLIAGEADFAITTADVGLDAASRGAKIKMIAGYMSSRPFLIMSRPDIKTVEQLKGKSVGIAPPHDVITVAWNHWLKSKGIKPTDIDQIYNTNTGARFAALTNGATAAAMLSPPVSFKAKKSGYNVILDMGSYMRGVPFLSIFAREDWLKTHADIARAFLATQSEAIDWFYDAKNRKRAVDVLAGRIKMSRPLIEETYDYYFSDLKPFSRKLAVSPKGLADEIDSMVEAHTIKSKAAVPAGFDDSAYRPK